MKGRMTEVMNMAGGGMTETKTMVEEAMTGGMTETVIMVKEERSAVRTVETTETATAVQEGRADQIEVHSVESQHLPAEENPAHHQQDVIGMAVPASETDRDGRSPHQDVIGMAEVEALRLVRPMTPRVVRQAMSSPRLTRQLLLSMAYLDQTSGKHGARRSICHALAHCQVTAALSVFAGQTASAKSKPTAIWRSAKKWL